MTTPATGAGHGWRSIDVLGVSPGIYDDQWWIATFKSKATRDDVLRIVAAHDALVTALRETVDAHVACLRSLGYADAIIDGVDSVAKARAALRRVDEGT